jgi:hypothetical protein
VKRAPFYKSVTYTGAAVEKACLRSSSVVEKTRLPTKTLVVILEGFGEEGRDENDGGQVPGHRKSCEGQMSNSRDGSEAQKGLTDDANAALSVSSQKSLRVFCDARSSFPSYFSILFSLQYPTLVCWTLYNLLFYLNVT